MGLALELILTKKIVIIIIVFKNLISLKYKIYFMLIFSYNKYRIIENMKLNEIKVILTGGKDDGEIQNGIQ